MPTLRGQRGIALPITIFVITLLTITLAASFARVDADRAVAGGTEDAVTALALAESGLQSYMGSQSSRPADGDSVRINLPGGYADVVAHVAQRPADPLLPQLYVVRSTGVVIVAEQGAVRQAVRTVAQFAQWQTGLVRQFAAFTAANDMDDRAPYRHAIIGTDECGDSAATWAVRTQNGSDMNQGHYTGAVIEQSSDNWVADTTGVVWDLIVNGDFEPDNTSLVTGDTLYKSYVIQGNATITSDSGSGLLAVTGDLTMSGAFAKWKGLVLVGGEIFFNATDTTVFRGMVISGLNEQLSGGNAPNARIGQDSVLIQYNSCNVRRSLGSLTGFTPLRNAWVDNWPTY